MEDTSSFTMPYRQLGNTGLRVSAISLGTNVTFGQQISDEMAEKITVFAYKQGVNLFETCECYGDGAAEITLGKILKNQNWRRSSYIVSVRISRGGKAATEQGLSRKHIVEGLWNALKKLQLDYVDILLVTRHPDYPNPIEEVVRTCTYLIQKGLVFYWGTSKWNPAEIMQAQSIARQFNLIPSALDQSEYHMFQRDCFQHAQEMSTKLNLGLIVGSPLAGGLLTGKYLDGIPNYSRATLKSQQAFRERILSAKGRTHVDQIRQLASLASRIQCTCAQLAIAWCLRTPFVNSVIIGAATVDQMQENLEAVLVVPRLNLAVLTEIECILAPESSDGFL